MTIRAEAVSNTKDIFCCQFAGKKLKNTDGFFGRSDPFLIISRFNFYYHYLGQFANHFNIFFFLSFVGASVLLYYRLAEDGSYVPCWKNERIDNNLNPVWPVSRINMVQLCNGDIDRPLRIDIWDWESSGRHQYMGQCETSVRSLMDSRGAAMNVIEPEKQKKSKSYVNSGTLTASNCVVEAHPTLSEVQI